MKTSAQLIGGFFHVLRQWLRGMATGEGASVPSGQNEHANIAPLHDDPLRESEERLRLAVEATGIGIWDVHVKRGVRNWSPEFRAILGLPLDTPADQKIFSERIHPADRERVEDLYAKAYRAASGGEYDVEFRIKRANDGALRWVETTGKVVFGSDGSPIRGVGTLSDITDRKDREEKIRALMRELSHRVKNQYAIILAMARQTSHEARSLKDFQDTFFERLQGLARAHDLLVGAEWNGATMQDILHSQLSPFVGNDQSRILYKGPAVTLAPEAVQSLGLAIHEMATNATKYGALSVPGGSIEITWDFVSTHSGQETLRLNWQEIGGPEVQTPSYRGFGHAVIEKLAPTSLGGTSSIYYDKKGLSWTIEFAGRNAEESLQGTSPHRDAPQEQGPP